MDDLVRGLYTSTTGMLVEMTRQETISNNLSNVNTAGYKSDQATFISFPERLLYATEGNATKPVGGLGLGTSIRQVGFNPANGPLLSTGNKTDFAIEGDGFFTLQTEQGVRYSRNGQFALDAEGRIVNSRGHIVQGMNGAIYPGSQTFDVNSQGQIFVNGNQVGQFQLFFPSQPENMEKLGDGSFVGGGPGIAGQARIVQGSLEGSNVNPTKEIIEMITGMRAYESNQRIIQVHDDLLGKAVNEVGRV